MVAKGNMKNQIMMITALCIVFTVLCSAPKLHAATNTPDIGIWYSTWYAKEEPIAKTWITNFGTTSEKQYVGDVNGDGIEDAIIYEAGQWNVALSNGSSFLTPTVWQTGHGAGSTEQVVGDVNGDSKQDAIVYFASSGTWYVALSNGSSFNHYSLWGTSTVSGADRVYVSDVNGDGLDDAVSYHAATGNWYVALSNGTGFNTSSLWIAGHGVGSNNQFVGDVNGDGKGDAVVYNASLGRWYVSLSNGTAFTTSYLWKDGHGVGSQYQLLHDAGGEGKVNAYVFFHSDVNGDSLAGDLYIQGLIMNSGFGAGSDQFLQGNVTNHAKEWKASIAFYKSTGTWQVEPYRYVQKNMYNTWDAWNINYKPLTNGIYETYDSGDAAVIDSHIEDITEAGIDFLLLDQTNNLYVDGGYIFDRAVAVSSRIEEWNNSSANPSLKYAIAVGGIQFTNPTNPANLEYEAGEVWSQFVNTIRGGSDNYYNKDGKPLLVVYASPAQRAVWESWTGSKTNSNKFTIRWAHSPGTAGSYGWEMRTGAIEHDEVMVVMPGWNNNKGVTPVSRSAGDFYANFGWERVLESTPEVIIINSYNEYAEESAVAITDTSLLSTTSEKWYNKNGQLDPSMYWNMTKQYIQLVKNPSYQASSLFSSGHWYRWSYKEWNGTSYSDMNWDAANQRWQGSYPYSLVINNKQHPDVTTSIRAWKAPASGTVTITGNARLESLSGDGVNVEIRRNSTVIWGTHLITTTSGLSHSLTQTVNKGDMIYFHVEKHGTNSYDTTLWDPTISYH